MSHWIVGFLRQLYYIWRRMMMSCSKKSSHLYFVSDVLSNVFLPWWSSNVYQEPSIGKRSLNNWTDSVSVKCILLHSNTTCSFSNIHQPFEFLFCFVFDSQQTPRKLSDYFKRSKSSLRNIAWSKSCYILQCTSRSKPRTSKQKNMKLIFINN